jgi:nicotinamidase-related amidase
MGSSVLTQLPIPSHFDPASVSSVWRVPYHQRAADAEAWAKQHGIQPASEDSIRVGLLLVDVQNTFCLPDFELFVGGRSGIGAIEDNQRLCEFIYRNLGILTAIVATMDTHTAMQIFHPIFWVNAAGQHPDPATLLSLELVEQGVWTPNPALADLTGGDLDQLQRYALHYARRLSQAGKYPLTIWPYHSMLGGIGHALVAAVEEACFFHAMARISPTALELKGAHPLTEHYSVLSPEVLEDPDGIPLDEPNLPLIEQLLSFDALIVAGQAKSHCVAWTVHDLLQECLRRDPTLTGKIYLLDDCSSAVVVPGGVDFTDMAEADYQRFASAGMHRVKSTAPLGSWPGVLGTIAQTGLS